MSTVPPSGTSTRPAALARVSAKSTVMGCSPTRPLTPSVPKYLRAKEKSSSYVVGSGALRMRGYTQGTCCMWRNLAVLHGDHYLQGIYRGGYVVDPEDTRAVQGGNHREGDAAMDSLL